MVLPFRVHPILPESAGGPSDSGTDGPPAPLPPPPTYTGSGLTTYDLRAAQTIADTLARYLGLDAPGSGMVIPFAVQVQIEVAGGDPQRSEGALRNNPLNLTGTGWDGQIGTWGGRFAAFDTLDNGARAAAANYGSADSGGYYRDVRAAMLTGDPIRLAEAIDSSPWNAGGYGGRIPYGTRLALGA